MARRPPYNHIEVELPKAGNRALNVGEILNYSRMVGEIGAVEVNRRRPRIHGTDNLDAGIGEALGETTPATEEVNGTKRLIH